MSNSTTIKILVTGGGGQLASSLAARSPVFTGIDLVTADRRKLDILDTEQIRRVLRVEQPDFVVNCAAYTAVDLAETHPERAFAVNEVGADNVAQICLVEGCGLVHISTDYVFNGKGSRPYREDDQTDPINVYGLSKLRGEQRVLKLLPEALVIRTSWLVSNREGNFLSTMRKLGRERKEVKVVDDQVASPTSADDLADFILQMIILGKAGKSDLKGIMHYTNGGQCSWYEFAQFIFAHLELNCECLPVDTALFGAAARRPGFSKLDCRKAEQISDQRIRSWKEAIAELLNNHDHE